MHAQNLFMALKDELSENINVVLRNQAIWNEGLMNMCLPHLYSVRAESVDLFVCMVVYVISIIFKVI